MSKELLHILLDDKFTDYAIDEFSQVYGNNLFIIIVSDKNLKIRYVKEIDKAEIIAYNSYEYGNLLKNINSFGGIIFHSLQACWHEEIFAALTNSKTKVGWVFWGAEVYERDELFKKFLGPRTIRIYYWKWLKHLVKALIRYRHKDLLNFREFHQLPASAFKRINVCITDLREDFEFVSLKLGCNFNYAWYNYYSIEIMLGELMKASIFGNNVLLGNSMTLTNNHLEAFNLLSKLPLDNRKIITPLSYGDINYRNIILNHGYRKLKGNFSPLNDFLERSEYNKILLTCNVVVMNHYRHQALGNIITSLWLGAKVYLSNRTTTYGYLKRLGIIVCSIEDDLRCTNLQVLESLTNEQVAQNRRILKNVYGQANILAQTKELVDVMIN